MATINDGGPAFPNPALANEAFSPHCDLSGMTLRDWFAGTATDMDVVKYQNWNAKEHWPEFTRAQARFLYADAMIAARTGEA